jgi:hypothetical protein
MEALLLPLYLLVRNGVEIMDESDTEIFSRIRNVAGTVK